MKILLVEDDATHAKLASAVLAAAGSRVQRVQQAEEVRAALAAEWPDAVLVDLRLPGKSGLDLVRELKASPLTRAIPVVCCTAYQEDFPEHVARAAGCDGFLLKPIDTRRLQAELESARRRFRSDE